MNQFVTVPETTLPGGRIVPAFKVGKFLASKNAKGRVAINAEGAPWVNITYQESKSACITAGLRLIVESQYLALAYQIAAQDGNWTGGKVGKGKLLQGLRKWSVKSAQPGSYTAKDMDECRAFVLPGGERIYDVAGNAYTWIFDDVQGDTGGLIAKAFAKDSPSLVTPYPGEDKGQGWTPRHGADWSGYALIRGGYWGSESNAGAFYLRNGWPDNRDGSVGFRCTQPIGL